MRRRQQREARAEAGAEDADAIVALRREPVNRAARVEHRLPADLHGPRDVGADDVVGAVQLGRHALIVVRQREAQRAHAAPGEQPGRGRRGRRRPRSTAAARAPPRAAGPRCAAHGSTGSSTVLFSGCGVVNALGNVRQLAAIVRVRRVDTRSVGGGVKNASVSRHDAAIQSHRRRRIVGLGAAVAPAAGRCAGIQSRPQSNGRTTRSVVTDARRRSHA